MKMTFALTFENQIMSHTVLWLRIRKRSRRFTNFGADAQIFIAEQRQSQKVDTTLFIS